MSVCVKFKDLRKKRENMDNSSHYGIDDFKHKIHTLLQDRDTKNILKARLRGMAIF